MTTHPDPRLVTNAFLVDPAWLAEHLADVLVVDCRFGGDRDCSLTAYRAGHVPGAIHSYWLDLCDVDTSVMTLLPDPGRAAAALSALGVGPASLVVAYADTANLYAARLWHLLRVHGHSAVWLLDGGLEAWTAAGGALETGDVAPRPTVFTSVAVDPPAAIEVDELRARLDELQLVDTRSPAEHTGTDVRAARGGHLPGARLLPWTELVDDQGRFLAPGDIARRATEAGLDPAAETVTYCQGGVRAAHSALALGLAGFDRVRVYNGSWAQWGNDPTLPIVTPAGAS